MAKADANKKRAGKCPICDATSEDRFRPFCSRRCADVDLSRWFSGGYAVPVVELDEGDLDELERFVDEAGADPDEAAGDSD